MRTWIGLKRLFFGLVIMIVVCVGCAGSSQCVRKGEVTADSGRLYFNAARTKYVDFGERYQVWDLERDSKGPLVEW